MLALGGHFTDMLSLYFLFPSPSVLMAFSCRPIGALGGGRSLSLKMGHSTSNQRLTSPLLSIQLSTHCLSPIPNRNPALAPPLSPN